MKKPSTLKKNVTDSERKCQKYIFSKKKEPFPQKKNTFEQGSTIVKDSQHCGNGLRLVKTLRPWIVNYYVI